MEKTKKIITLEKFREVREAMCYYRDFSMQQMREYVQLKEQFRCLTKDNQKVLEEKEALSGRVEDLESKVQQLDSDLKQKDRLLKGKEASEVDWKSKISHLEEQLATLSRALSTKDEELADFSLELDNKNQELQSLRAYIDRSNVIFEQLEVVGEENHQDSQLSSEITNLKKALEIREAEVTNLRSTIAESTTRFQTLWTRRETEVAAERDALSASHEVQVAQLHQHIASVSDRLEVERKEAAATKNQLQVEQERFNQTVLSCNEALAAWDQRWAARELEAAAEVKDLQEQHQAQLSIVLKEKQAASTSAVKERLALTEQHLGSLTKLTKLELQLSHSEDQWRKKVEDLEGQLKKQLEQAREAEESWISKQEKWLQSQRETKLDTQVLVERIVYLTDFASKTDREKAKIKKAEEKAREKACKRRWKEKSLKRRSLSCERGSEDDTGVQDVTGTGCHTHAGWKI